MGIIFTEHIPQLIQNLSARPLVHRLTSFKGPHTPMESLFRLQASTLRAKGGALDKIIKFPADFYNDFLFEAAREGTFSRRIFPMITAQWRALSL
jgi:hypothetical protein